MLYFIPSSWNENTFGNTSSIVSGALSKIFDSEGLYILLKNFGIHCSYMLKLSLYKY